MFTEGNETHVKFLDLKSHFLGKCIEDDFQLYNILEKTILEIEFSKDEKE
jgi:hypothetical protein